MASLVVSSRPPLLSPFVGYIRFVGSNSDEEPIIADALPPYPSNVDGVSQPVSEPFVYVAPRFLEPAPALPTAPLILSNGGVLRGVRAPQLQHPPYRFVARTYSFTPSVSVPPIMSNSGVLRGTRVPQLMHKPFVYVARMHRPSPGEQPPSTVVKVDWQRDGSFSEAIDDVTQLVRARHGALNFEYGRDQSTALAPTVAGRGSMVLTNRDRRFSPRNTSSPLYGFVKPSRPVKITRIVAGIEYVLFIAHTDDSPINPDINNKTVTLSMVDSLADFRGQNITTPLYAGIRTGEAINYVLDACGWDPVLRDIDSGTTAIPWWWEDNTDALTALEKILRSEGPPAMLTVGSDGSIVFKDRHHRLFDAESLTSQQTWQSTVTPGSDLGGYPGGYVGGYLDGYGAGNPDMQAFSYDDAWRNIVNVGIADVDIRQPDALQPIWSSDASITLANGEQRVITVSTSDPFYGAITPELGTDYTVMSGVVTVQLNRTSGASAGIVLTAISGPAVISNLQVRAYPVPVIHSVQVSASDAASISDYGARSFPSDLPWCNQYDAVSIMDTAIAMRSQPLPIVEAQFQAAEATKASRLLPLNLSAMVTIHEPETGLDGVNFYIESIGHELDADLDHVIKFGCEAVPVQPSPLFRFDTPGAGFDDGKWGSGLDDPATVFRFDTPGHGWDQGMWSS